MRITNRRPPHPTYGCEIDDPYRYRSVTDNMGNVLITDRRYGFKVYIPAEEADRDLQQRRASQEELAAYFRPGATVTNTAGRAGIMGENKVEWM